jgi:uncharacterized protein (UPF0333 family)
MHKIGQIKKEYLLLAASLVMLVICYQLAFKKSIEAWHQHRQLQAQAAQTFSGNFQPGYSERKSANISKILNLYKADTVNFRSNIIGRISSIAEKENVKLAEVPADDPSLHNNKLIHQKLAFEGDYFSLVKTLNELQKTPEIGVVRSIDLKSAHSNDNEHGSKLPIMTVELEFTR